MQPNEKLSPVVAGGILVTITICIMIFILQSSREYPQYNAERIRLRNSLNDSQYDVEVNGIKYKVREYCIRSHTEYSGGFGLRRRWWSRGSSKTVCDEYTTDSIRVNTHHTYKN
jgi:hypothetical protein